MDGARPPGAVQGVEDATSLGLGGLHAFTAREPGLRVGVVGCGYWGSKHVRVLDATDGVAEVVVVDSPRRAPGQAGSQLQVGLWSHSPSSAALEHVDAVVVATPPSTHVAVALQAIEAGKHVLVEKPLAPTTAGARLLHQRGGRGGRGPHGRPHVRVQPGGPQAPRAGRRRRARRAVLHRQRPAQPGPVPERRQRHPRPRARTTSPSSTTCWAARRSRSRRGPSRHAHHRFEDVAYLRLFYDDFFDDRGLSANIHVSWLDPCKVRRVTAVGQPEDGRLRRPRRGRADPRPRQGRVPAAETVTT